MGRQVAARRIEQVFGEIFRKNVWGSPVSLSGSGSDLEQTRVVRAELPKLCAELGVSRLLDVPCGDFHWMQHTDLKGLSYWGADIVPELIESNSLQYGDPSNARTFLVLDLLCNALPDVDLIFCRDCLVHLSAADIFEALGNICRSKAQYLLTTTFTARTDNTDILTGGWRPINLCLAPFHLPQPMVILTEQCTEEGNQYGDKSLGLWRISDIATVVRNYGEKGA